MLSGVLRPLGASIWRRGVRLAGAVILAALAAGAPLRAASPDSGPPLPAPSGTVVQVATEAQLQAAIGNVASGMTIVIAPGTYALTSTLWINRNVSDVVIRGASNNRNDVVLVGRGMGTPDADVPFGLWTGGGATRVTLANLTIRDVYYHAVVFNAGTQQPRLYNVRLADAGEQIVKANPDGAGGGVNGGLVEYSVIEYTSAAPSDYTNGVDVHTGRDWVLRHNLFRRIRSNTGLAGPAVLMWNHSTNSTVESNTFVDCHRDISLGLVQRASHDHEGGIIRNNVIVRSAGAGGDVGIAVFDSPATRVVHNTVYLGDVPYPNAIEYRFAAATGLVIVNNLADRPAAARDGAVATLAGNVWTASAVWFVNPAARDLHLAATANGAIDKGAATSDAPTDWDGDARPNGAASDVGADELNRAPPPPIEICGDGIDNDGDGLIDEGCAAVPLTPPGPPARLVGTVTGSSVTFRWLAPISGGAVTRYQLEAGFSRGSTFVSSALSAATSATVNGVGVGTYFVRVRGVNASGAGPATADVAVTIGCSGAPVTPRGFTAQANGSAVSLAWIDDAGCEGTQYRVLAGSAPGLSNLGIVPASTPGLQAVAPAGHYFLRVVADRGGRTSPPSNETDLLVGGPCAPPAFPVALAGNQAARRLDLRWEPTSAAAAIAADDVTPLAYVLEAGRAPRAADLGVFPMGRTTAVAVTVPPGAYYLRVRASSACGAGPASPELALIVH